MPARKYTTQLPFMGFYESYYDHGIDSEHERETDNLKETLLETFTESDLLEADISDSDIFDTVRAGYKHHETQIAICKEFVPAFNKIFLEETGINLGLKFQEMTSPREYNFTTDKVFAHIPRRVIRLLKKEAFKLDDEKAQEILDSRHKSRSGFISFYPHDLNVWKKKASDKFDEIEIMTLVLLVAELHGLDLDEWERDFALGDICYSEIMEYDYAANEYARADLIDTINAAITPSDNPYHMPKQPPCPATLNLFAGVM